MKQVLDPQGNPYKIEESEVEQALANGWSLEDEKATQERHQVQQYVKENDNAIGALKVLGGQFADEFLGGIPEAVLDRNSNDIDKRKREALKQSHDIANAVGGVGGFAGSMLLPLGLVGKAAKLGTSVGRAVEGGLAAESLIGKLGSKALAGAVEGAVTTAPQTVAHVIEGDVETAGETMLLGALLGVGAAPFRVAGTELATAASKVNPETLKKGVSSGLDSIASKGADVAARSAGLGLGGVPGYLAGELLGKPIQEAVEPGIKKALADYQVASRLGNFVAQEFDALPSYLNKLNKAGFTPATVNAHKAAGVLSLVKRKDWENHVGQVNRMASAPPIATDSPYEQAYNQQQTKAAQYLQSQLPKVDLLPKPFGKDFELPSKQDTDRYLRTVSLVQNPFLLLDKMNQGTLTPQDVSAVKAVYPKLYEKMVGDVMALGMNPKYQSLPAAKKRVLEVLIESPLDRSFSPESLALTQNMYAQSTASNQPKKTNVKVQDQRTDAQKATLI